MKCNDCIRCDVCKNLDGVFADSFTERDNIEEHCEYFKDRSKIVELPCKIGDRIYRIIFCYDRNSRPAKKIPNHYLEEPVVGIHICDSRLRVNALSTKKYRDYIIVKCNNTNQLHHIPIVEIGKTVFLIKEEAEKALED